MKKLIADFSSHLQDAIQQANSLDIQNIGAYNNVLISGLGGSGIGGSIIADLCSPVSSIPILVNKNYSIPSFVNEETLFVACSYSGNTEETISAVKKAIDKKATVVCISSGGELLQLAKDNGFKYLSMEGGNPPRSMLAYAFTYLLYFLKKYGFILFDVEKSINNAISLLDSEEEKIKSESKELAEKLAKTTPAIYAAGGSLGIAARWRQQLNENAKMLAWQGEIPEMNHNELVGWEGGNSNYAAVILRNSTDFTRSQKRIEIIKDIISEKTEHFYEIWSKGNDPIENALYLIHYGDWLSYHLSEIRGVDIMDIKSIDLLKSELSKIPR